MSNEYSDKQMKGENEGKNNDKDDEDGKKKAEIKQKLEENKVYYDGRWSLEDLENQLEKYEIGSLRAFWFGGRGEYKRVKIYADNSSKAKKVFEEVKIKV